MNISNLAFHSVFSIKKTNLSISLPNDYESRNSILKLSDSNIVQDQKQFISLDFHQTAKFYAPENIIPSQDIDLPEFEVIKQLFNHMPHENSEKPDIPFDYTVLLNKKNDFIHSKKKNITQQ